MSFQVHLLLILQGCPQKDRRPDDVMGRGCSIARAPSLHVLKEMGEHHVSVLKSSKLMLDVCVRNVLVQQVRRTILVMHIIRIALCGRMRECPAAFKVFSANHQLITCIAMH